MDKPSIIYTVKSRGVDTHYATIEQALQIAKDIYTMNNVLVEVWETTEQSNLVGLFLPKK